MALDDAALAVGREIVKHAVRAWMGIRQERDRRGSDLIELLGVSVTDTFRRRDLARRLEDIGDQAARRLKPLYDTEFRDVPENERLAALEAVGDSLMAADLDDQTLFVADADEVKLAREVRRRVPNATRQAGLSDGASRLYQMVLDQSCLALVSIVRQLPEFQPAALSELLGRVSSLADDIGLVLERLPRTSLDAPHGTEHDVAFHRRYLEKVSTELDALEIFGIDVHRYRPRTQVSVAYFSLTVTTGDRVVRYGRNAMDDSWFEGRHRTETTGVRVEAALTDRHRTFLRGEAGSGKTTLLQWLAVNCARGSFSGRLASWNGRTPFLVRLRHYADRPLPRPEQFLDEIGSMTVGVMPDGWVHRQLRDSAVLLVDGVDELVPAQRRGVRDWLGRICHEFPDLPVVVTSRPGAAGQSWLDEHGFGSVLLEPMSSTDITQFCRRWHQAIRQATAHDPSLLPCPVDKLDRYEAELLRNFDINRHLRTLATNPLLCAMLCALNLDRNMQLPPDRMSLYEAALNLLLERRDAEREIPAAALPRLSAKVKIAILQHLAWRLTDAGRAEMSFEDCVEHVDRAVGRLPGLTAKAADVLRQLLERSGVIREPAVGRVDFVHRTFQEYLAAKEAAEDHLPDVLVQHATADQWRETIVMAAGHGTPRYRAALLTKLLERAEREPKRARSLRLLAVACLDTAHTVDRQVTDRVDQALDTVLPPRSTRESRSVALAGGRVLDRLPSSLDGISDAAAAACVRAAALVNGPTALRRLASYASDPRAQVQNELAEVWRYFDPEEYATRVLTDAPLWGGMIIVRRSEHVPHLSRLTQLTETWVFVDDVDDLSFVAGTPCLRKLSCSPTRPVTDLSPLLAHQQLETLRLYRGGTTADLSLLCELPGLCELTTTVRGPFSIGFAGNLPALTRLHISFLDEVNVARAVADIDTIARLHKLTQLGLSDCPDDFTHLIVGLTKLSELTVDYSRLPDMLARIRPVLPRLTYLSAWACQIEDLAPLTDAESLESLNIGRTTVTNLEPLTRLNRLRWLYLYGCAPDLDLSPLARLPRKARIFLSRGDRVRGLDAVRGRHRITWS